MRRMSASGPSSREPLVRTVPLVALLTALLVALPAALLSGAVVRLPILDPGPVVRWGLPVLGIVNNLAGALTIGLFFVAAFFVREGPETDRRGAAVRAASVSALVWLLATIAETYLTFGLIAGYGPERPGYLTELLASVWRLDPTKLLTIQTGLIAALVLLSGWVRTRTEVAWAAVLALVCLTPAAFAGHSTNMLGHETAVTALGLHLVGLSLWVGGLMAIGLLLPVLGPALPDTVRRFSVLATWSYALVALSGILFSTVTVGSWEALRSSYGTIVLLKVTLLVLLGVAGWLQRERVVARGVDNPARFLGLATGELVLMGAAVGLGVVLGRTPPPQQEAVESDIVLSLTMAPLPEPWHWGRLLTEWRVDWLFTLVALTAVGLYLWGVVRLRRRGDRWPWWRALLWVLGWAAFLYVTSGAPGIYGRVMFSLHMVMHMGLMMFIPILLVPAQAITLAVRALPARKDTTLGPREVLLALVHSRWARFIANPLVAGVIFFGSLVAFYWTPLLQWALTSHAGHIFMVVHFTLSGYAFVWSLVGQDPGPPKWPAPLRILVLLGTLAAHAFFGLALMQGTWLLAPAFFKTIDVPWVADLLHDQQIGGTIAWGIGELPTVVLVLMVVVDWMRRDERESVRTDRRAERDHGAELAAYNARLQALAEQDDRDRSHR